jgi:hypothetical protein
MMKKKVSLFVASLVLLGAGLIATPSNVQACDGEEIMVEKRLTLGFICAFGGGGCFKCGIPDAPQILE